MRYALSAAWMLACLLLATGLVAPMIGDAWGGDAQVASVSGDATLPVAKGTETRAPRHDMTPLPKTAQMRCPAGQLVFLSAACGCNGACCACSLAARYLNHCTCQCQQGPPAAAACKFGFSVGSQ